MDVELRSVTLEEFDSYGRSIGRAFGDHPVQEELDVWRRVFEPDRSIAAFDGTEIVGTTGANTLQLTVPGSQLQMAGVTAVGVSPTHRRRGLLTSMMRKQLDDVHERGELLAGLWASESVIYGRFGYGLATFALEVSVERHRSAFRHPVEDGGRVVLVSEKAEWLDLVGPVYDRVRTRVPGMFERTRTWWEVMTADVERWRDGASALFLAVHDSPSGPDGYVAYRVKQEWENGASKSTLRVRDLVAENPDAYAALWRFCLDVDLIAKIEGFPRPVDEPLMHLVMDPRRLNMRLWDGLWLRLVDVPKALAARRYAQPGRVVFEVRDPFCPWNDGCYELEVAEDGTARCEPASGEPDVTIDARELAAAYLGGMRFGPMQRARLVDERTAGALARADAMFAWDPQPWCPEIF